MVIRRLAFLTTMLVALNTSKVGQTVTFVPPVNPRSEVVIEEVKKTTKVIEEVALERNLTYNRYDLTQPSGVWVEELGEILRGTELAGLEDVIVYCEQTYNVNAFFLLALVSWESDYGRSELARYKNNLTGYMAYNDSPYVSAKVFNTKDECVVTTAKLISTNYLSYDGMYYNGLSIDGVNIRYCLKDDGSVNTIWADGISQVAEEYRNKVSNLPPRIVRVEKEIEINE